jgi:hypothetical protein
LGRGSASQVDALPQDDMVTYSGIGTLSTCLGGMLLKPGEPYEHLMVEHLLLGHEEFRSILDGDVVKNAERENGRWTLNEVFDHGTHSARALRCIRALFSLWRAHRACAAGDWAARVQGGLPRRQLRSGAQDVRDDRPQQRLLRGRLWYVCQQMGCCRSAST